RHRDVARRPADEVVPGLPPPPSRGATHGWGGAADMTGNLTTARRTSPRRCGRGEDRGERTLWLRELIGKPVVGPEEQHLGHVDDVAARRTDDPQGPVVTGLVTDVGGLRLFAPASAVR